MGFGPRGTEGKIAAVRYARENKVPFFGICFGMQMAVIEFARTRLRPRAGELDRGRPERPPHPVIDLMPEQRGVTKKGGTMRLGAYPCVLAEGTLARRLYGKRQDRTSAIATATSSTTTTASSSSGAGLVLRGRLAGRRAGRDRRDCPTTRGSSACQFHPEFKSRPTDCHPLFKGFIRAALQHKAARQGAPLLGGLKVVKR